MPRSKSSRSDGGEGKRDRGGDKDDRGAEAAPGVDRRPGEREPRPAERGPDKGPRVPPDRRPVVEPEGGEDDEPGADQQRRQGDGPAGPAAVGKPQRRQQAEQERRGVEGRQHQHAQGTPQGLEAEQLLQDVFREQHAHLRGSIIAPASGRPPTPGLVPPSCLPSSPCRRLWTARHVLVGRGLPAEGVDAAVPVARGVADKVVADHLQPPAAVGLPLTIVGLR